MHPNRLLQAFQKNQLPQYSGHKAAGSSQTTVTLYQITRLSIPEDRYLH
jgi:hypothetical protein